MSRDGDLDKIIKNAQVQGFRYSRTTAGHHQFYAPNGHNIITHSGTPSDSRGYLNFIADMKRAGYMELQTLADAMPKPPKEQEEKPPEVRPKLSMNEHVISYVDRHPEGVTAANTKAYLRSVRPESGGNAHYNVLAVLMKKGVVKRLPSGNYVSTGKKLEAIGKGTNPNSWGNKGKAQETPEPFRAKTGDTSVDKDLKALDAALNDALTALTKVDSIAQRMKAKLARLAQIQELLK